MQQITNKLVTLVAFATIATMSLGSFIATVSVYADKDQPRFYCYRSGSFGGPGGVNFCTFTQESCEAQRATDPTARTPCHPEVPLHAIR